MDYYYSFGSDSGKELCLHVKFRMEIKRDLCIGYKILFQSQQLQTCTRCEILLLYLAECNVHRICSLSQNTVT